MKMETIESYYFMCYYKIALNYNSIVLPYVHCFQLVLISDNQYWIGA